MTVLQQQHENKRFSLIATGSAAAEPEGAVKYLNGVVYKRYGDSHSILGGIRWRQRKGPDLVLTPDCLQASASL